MHYYWVKLSPIAQYSSLLVQKIPGPFFNSSVADRSLKPAIDFWLGKSKYQIPNQKLAKYK